MKKDKKWFEKIDFDEAEISWPGRESNRRERAALFLIFIAAMCGVALIMVS